MRRAPTTPCLGCSGDEDSEEGAVSVSDLGSVSERFGSIFPVEALPRNILVKGSPFALQKPVRKSRFSMTRFLEVVDWRGVVIYA